MLQASARLHEAGAEVILVLREGAAPAPDAVIGVIDQPALLRLLKDELDRAG